MKGESTNCENLRYNWHNFSTPSLTSSKSTLGIGEMDLRVSCSKESGYTSNSSVPIHYVTVLTTNTVAPVFFQFYIFSAKTNVLEQQVCEKYNMERSRDNVNVMIVHIFVKFRSKLILANRLIFWKKNSTS